MVPGDERLTDCVAELLQIPHARAVAGDADRMEPGRRGTGGIEQVGPGRAAAGHGRGVQQVLNEPEFTRRHRDTEPGGPGLASRRIVRHRRTYPIARQTLKPHGYVD